MAKIASRDMDLTVNSVALECYTDSVTFNIKPETPVVTAFCDAGPRRIPANYDWDSSLSGPNDFASGALDATIHALLGSTGVAQTLETTGAAAGANSPTYTGSVVLGSYSIQFGVGQAAKYNATLLGTTALTRNVA